MGRSKSKGADFESALRSAVAEVFDGLPAKLAALDVGQLRERARETWNEVKGTEPEQRTEMSQLDTVLYQLETYLSRVLSEASEPVELDSMGQLLETFAERFRIKSLKAGGIKKPNGCEKCREKARAARLFRHFRKQVSRYFPLWHRPVFIDGPVLDLIVDEERELVALASCGPPSHDPGDWAYPKLDIRFIKASRTWKVEIPPNRYGAGKTIDEAVAKMSDSTE
jgi:hypothetical protein